MTGSSTADNLPVPPALEVGSKPLLIRFNGDDEQKPPTIVDPFDDDGGREEILELQMLQGKQCLACFEGEWLLMFDDGTSECFLLSLASLSKIPLPPLLTPVEPLCRCALSSSPTLPGCTVMFSTFFENYLVYCKPGDDEWWELPDETDGTYNAIMGDIVSSHGRFYVPTDMGSFIMIDGSLPSSYQVKIEERGIPHPSTVRWGTIERLVESDGDVFLLQFYLYGMHSSEVIGVDIHRLDTSRCVWSKVESIGDRAIFVGGNCAVLSPASRAGIRPGCVHLLHESCPDGIRLYTIQLDDWTMTFKLLPGSSYSKYWVIPPSFKKEINEPLTSFSTNSDNRIKLTFDEDSEHVTAAPWSTLPLDMVEELVPRISFIDYFNVREVCKSWSSISKPIQYATRYPTYPMLMSICSSPAGVLKLFDPIVEKEYTVKNNSLVPCNDYFQMLLFAKHGWVMVMRGAKYMFAANPFTGDMVELPEIPWLGNEFDGISFSSTPKSPDCMVFTVCKERNPSRNDYLYVMVWRVGDEHWTSMKIDDHTQFRTAYSNPVFYHGEFYCLGTRGNLGVFNPDNMTWRVLDKPGPVLDGDPMPGDLYCHLLEFRDDLVAIFRPHGDGPIDLYRLDRSQMIWTKIERLDDEVIFVDNWNAVMMPAPRDGCSNRIYVPKPGGFNRVGEADKSAFYDVKSRKYYPSYYGLTERMNSIWVEPNFRHQGLEML
ncbi:hypothetical protein ACP70R_005099 [Stipagrostis hirtigluma subsp. patula]